MQPDNDPPPPYPGPPSFPLLSYAQATAVDECEDSLRLPSYQPRSGRRYHPYWSMRLNPQPDIITRFQNTIFDESYTPLDVSFQLTPPPAPATSPPTALVIPPAPIIPAPLPPPSPPPVFYSESHLTPEERHYRRVLRVLHLIPEFEQAVRRSLEEAKKARARCRTQSHDTIPGDDDHTIN